MMWLKSFLPLNQGDAPRASAAKSKLGVFQRDAGGKTESKGVQQTHPISRKYLELAQDLIVFGLCAMLLVAMAIKLTHLGELLFQGADFSLVVGDILFILVLVELFRLLLIYLEEHRVSVATMVEVGIVATLREVILLGTLHISWQHLLVVSVFILSLAMVLRYAGLRSPGGIAEER
ncbi:MAG TPA: phosphate-starvation-inducible PsiE family protein [Candidatus Binatia bacterium]|nr:phosphate-starvation-inducible PsiE family protein [Candidatus Binatia bacterium]